MLAVVHWRESIGNLLQNGWKSIVKSKTETEIKSPKTRRADQ